MFLEDIAACTTDEAGAFLRDHAGDDPRAVALMKIPPGVSASARALAEQIDCRAAASVKLPFFCVDGVLFDATALEQATPEAVSRWRGSFMAGKRLLDCTTGLGADLFISAERFDEVVGCELDTMRASMLRHNRAVLQKENVRIEEGDCVGIVGSLSDDSFDWVFIDPARRDAGRRVFLFSDCQPDIVSLLPELLRIAPRVCIKASPLFDAQAAFSELSGLTRAVYISWMGECREAMFIAERDKGSETIESVVLRDDGSVLSHCVRMKDERGVRLSSSVGHDWYEPDPAIIKAGCSTVLADVTGLLFVNDSVDYMTGDVSVPDFPGRIFTVVKVIEWDRKTASSYLKENGIHKANVAKRDFPMDVAAIRKMLALKDGGEEFLFFTKDREGGRVMVHCRKVKK